MKPATLSYDALLAAVEKLPDDGLAVTRRAALDHLHKHGLPTTRHEDWKYTDLTKIVDIGNQFLDGQWDQPTSQATGDLVNSIRDSIEADWLVMSNGIIDQESIAGLGQTGISVTRLSEADGEMEFSTPLSDLNAALLYDGLRIHVAADAALTRPIGILLVDDATTSPGMSQTRIEIELAASSTASFIEYHASSGSADHYANSVSNLKLGDNSHADYVRIQERDRSHNQTNRLTVGLGRDSRFNHCAFDFGGRLVRNDLTVDIAHPGATAAFDGLYLAGGQQHIDNHTRADHRVGPGISHQEYRGIMTGHARGVWNGKAIVHDGADGTDAEQANHNLLLSDKAEIDAKPELEIYADDVKCSHGTTVGQLDETALFYLRTRGLNEHEAKQILTRAFAQAIVSKSPIDSIHEMLTTKIAARLSGLMQGVEA
jgi:Fe-S cluster assembly protein SufD